MKAPKFPDAGIVFLGFSRHNREPIVAILTGINGSSTNKKTGPMAQLWIIRSDMSPVRAIFFGKDDAICFGCKLRGTPTTKSEFRKLRRMLKDRVCYVTMKAPQSIWRKFKAGKYPMLNPADVAAYLRSQGRTIRLGAYAEPVALPVDLLDTLTSGGRHTGYTHEWRTTPEYRHLLNASVDTVAEALEAQRLGWRYFRTRFADDPLLPGEIACPASDEAGHRTNCADCTLCDGSRGPQDRRRNLAIIIHGSNKANFIKVIRRDGTVAA